MKKILITGSTGFIGNFLVNELLKNNYSICEVTRNIQKSTSLYNNETHKILTDSPDFTEQVKDFNPEIVIHLASHITPKDDWNSIENLINSNILFTSKILNSLMDLNVKLFVNTGTFAEYFSNPKTLNPAYFYAATKTASRSIVDYYSTHYNFKTATIVPYTIYGGLDNNKKIIDLIIQSTFSNKTLRLSPGHQKLDFLHIKDLCDFYLKLILKHESIPNNTEFKLGTGIGTTPREVAKIIEVVCSKKTNIEWGGINYRKNDVMIAIADIQNAKKFLNWEPKIILKHGITEYVKLMHLNRL